MRLRRRIVALDAALLALSLAVGGALTYWQGLDKVAREMRSALEVGEAGVKDALASLDPAGTSPAQLERIISAFDGDRHLRATLRRNDGAIALASRPQPAPDPAPAWLIGLLSHAPSARTVPLPTPTSDLSAIMLTAEPANEISEVWEDAKLKLLIVGTFCALVLAMTEVLLERALRPLEKLSDALARVGEGDYRVKVDEHGPEELAVIYRAFNQMAGELEASERANTALNEQLTTVQEEERAEIARDLHDDVGPFLFAVDTDAQIIPALLAKGRDSDVIARAHAIRQAVRHMQTHLRSLLARLRPALLLDLGLPPAIDNLTAFWKARRPGLTFVTNVTDEPLPADIKDAAFRVVQEATSNAVRHGKPTRIAVSIAHDTPDAILIAIVDNGRGLPDAHDTAAVARNSSRHYGMTGMSERIRQLGGTLDIRPADDGQGVHVSASVPLPNARLPSGEQLHPADRTT